MKLILSIFLALSLSADASDFDENKFMNSHGLSLFNLDSLPYKQFFKNHRYVSLDSSGLGLSEVWQSPNILLIESGGIQYKGINKGEFGGSLTVTENGEEKLLMKGNIVHLLQLGEKLYIIEGLAHMGMASGSISVIHNINEPIPPELVTLLPDAPLVTNLNQEYPDQKELTIVGSKSLMELDIYSYEQKESYSLSTIHWDAMWGFSFTPTSVVKFKRNYYVGLAHGVAVIPLFGPSSKYCRNSTPYLPPNSCRGVRFYADQEFNKASNPTP
jgi:hypothetical protein